MREIRDSRSESEDDGPGVWRSCSTPRVARKLQFRTYCMYRPFCRRNEGEFPTLPVCLCYRVEQRGIEPLTSRPATWCSGQRRALTSLSYCPEYGEGPLVVTAATPPQETKLFLSQESLFSDAPSSRDGTSCVLHTDTMTFFATAWKVRSCDPGPAETYSRPASMSLTRGT